MACVRTDAWVITTGVEHPQGNKATMLRACVADKNMDSIVLSVQK
jgi:hypothetical protein